MKQTTQFFLEGESPTLRCLLNLVFLILKNNYKVIYIMVILKLQISYCLIQKWGRGRSNLINGGRQ